jgi:hypothetical protein
VAAYSVLIVGRRLHPAGQITPVEVLPHDTAVVNDVIPEDDLHFDQFPRSESVKQTEKQLFVTEVVYELLLASVHFIVGQFVHEEYLR